jgi:hypothetical protein
MLCERSRFCCYSNFNKSCVVGGLLHVRAPGFTLNDDGVSKSPSAHSITTVPGVSTSTVCSLAKLSL